MTTHRDSRVWQDVYHADTPAGKAYVKLTLRTDGAPVIQFKELEP
jgi:motility quorum-sensing regulator/GCU-specific mRNA interferase toxin